MNPRRGWNLDLEESYLLEYSESEDETWKLCTSGIYLLLVNVLASGPSLILRYRKYTKPYQFQYFRVFQARGQTGLTFLKFHRTKNIDPGL